MGLVLIMNTGLSSQKIYFCSLCKLFILSFGRSSKLSYTYIFLCKNWRNAIPSSLLTFSMFNFHCVFGILRHTFDMRGQCFSVVRGAH